MELILDGVKLMVIGMLTVYVFLMIMIFCMNLMAKILAPLAAAAGKSAWDAGLFRPPSFS